MRKLSESVWGDLRKRSSGEVTRREDDVNHMDFDTFADYIEDNYSEMGNWFAVRESEDGKSRHIEIDIIYRKEIDLSFNVVDGELYNILVQGNKNYVDIPGLKEIFNVNIIGSSTFSVYEKNWTISNNTFVKLIEFYLNKKTNESVWGDLRKRSSGEVTRREDNVNLLDLDGLYDYIKSRYDKKVFYLDKTWYNEIYVDVLANISLILKPNGNGGLLHVLLSWSKEKISMPFFDKLSERFKVENPSVNRRIIKEKDGTITNQTFIDVIDFFLDNIDNMLVNESVWGDLRKRSSGEVERREDDVLTDMEINSLNEFTLMYCREERAYYIQNHIVPPPPSRRKENDYEGLIKYIEDRRDENMFTNVGDYEKIIRYIKKNWDTLDMDTYIKKWICSPDVMKGRKIVECEGVPGGITPAYVGGMGAAYFPGPNGEPGSGDLPSPTGIVYHQVAPYTTFLKQIKKKKKKTKKFRKEDEPCAHSENPPIYSHVDDFRDYVDRVYNQIDRKK